MLSTNDIKDTDAFCGSNGGMYICPVHIAVDYNPAEAGWFKDYNLQEVLNEMKTVRTVSIQGSRKKYTTELTQFPK